MNYVNPQKGQRVKCVFKNGMVVEGIVEQWEPTVTAVLKSLSDESILIIPRPLEDIMLIKVFPVLTQAEQIAEKIKRQPPVERWEDQERANYDLESMRDEFRERLYGNEEKFKEVVKETDHLDPEQVKSLAELRVELNKQEKEIISRKLKEHHPTVPPGTNNYHYPSVINKPKSAYKPGKLPRWVLDGKPGPDKK